MTRRKQTQPVQRRNSEGEGSTGPVEDEEVIVDPVDEQRPLVGERDESEKSTTEHNRMAIERGVRSSSTSVCGTDSDDVTEGACSPQLNDTSSRRRDNDENDNSTLTLDDVKVERRHKSTPSDDVVEVKCKIERSSTPVADDTNLPEVIADSDVKASLVDRVASWKRATDPSAETEAIGSLVDKYSSLIPDDIMSASGRSSSVAQLESFVASVAAAEVKPPHGGASSQPMMPSLLPLVSAAQSVGGGGGSTSRQSSSGHHHSKHSKSKSTTPGVGVGHALKSSGSRSTTKTPVHSGSSSAMGSTLPLQNPTSMFSAIGLLAPIIPFQCVASAAPVAAAAAGPAAGNGDQPLDLSTKSSRSETKYLSPDVSNSATGQGLSSLLSLERQFGKGSAIFDKIGTKAWASPYCAAAIRFGMAAYSASASGLSSDLSSHQSMPPPSALPLSSSSTTGSSSTKLTTSGSRSASDDTTHRTQSRRTGHGDASSLLPWTQPLVSTDQKKHSVSAAGNASTTSSSKSAANQHHHHVHTNFRCSCGTTTETLYDLTLHIQKTGHSPAPPNSMTTQSALDAEAATSVGGSIGAGSSAVTSGGNASGGGNASSSKPYEYSKLVRGQDVWLSGGGERTRRSILRCIECGESFRSLPELTVHMVHTRHYTNIVGGGGGGGSGGGDAASTLSSGGTASSHLHSHHSHHHQQPRKHGHHQSGDKMAAAAGNSASLASFRSKGSSPVRAVGSERSSPSTPSAAQRLVANARCSPKSRDMISSGGGGAIQPTGKELDDRKLAMTSSATCYSDVDDEDIDDEADSFVRTPLKHGGGSSSYCGSSRTPSPTGSTLSTPTVGGKRPWSAMARGESAERPTRRNDNKRSGQHESETDGSGGSKYQDKSGNERVNIRDGSSGDVEGLHNPEDKKGSSSRRNVASPSVAVDCRRRFSPDEMSSDKVKQALSRPLSPTGGSVSSLSAIKAMESFIHSSFGRHAQTATIVPTTPRSSTSPLTSKNTRPSSTSIQSMASNFREHVDDNMPTDLTMSSSTVTRHRGDFAKSTSNASRSNRLEKKASPLTGTRDADSSTSMAGEYGGLSGDEQDTADDVRSTPEAWSKTFTGRGSGDKIKIHGKRSHARVDEHHDEQRGEKYSKNEDLSSHQARPNHRHHRRRQHRKSSSDEKNFAEQERPTSSSSSFGRHSALDSLQGLVYGQTLNSEHPLDSLQKLIYGGGGGAAAASGGGPGTAAEVSLNSEFPVSSAALGSGNEAFLNGVGSRSVLHGHHTNASATSSPFGSGAFHTSLLGPQTLILVNPIVTVVSQAGNGTTGSGSSLSITLPGHPSASVLSPSLTQLCLSTSSKSSGSDSSSSSSAGSSPSDVHSSTVTATAESASRAGNLPSAGRESSSGRCPSPSLPRVYRCRGCRRKFSSKGSYRYHLSRCHVLTTSSSSPGAATKSPMVTSETPVAVGSEVFHRPKSADEVQTSSSRSGHHSGPTAASAAAAYGGCVPLDGSARLQARYLPMDAAGAQ